MMHGLFFSSYICFFLYYKTLISIVNNFFKVFYFLSEVGVLFIGTVNDFVTFQLSLNKFMMSQSVLPVIQSILVHIVVVFYRIHN